MQELPGKRRVSKVQWKREGTLAFKLPLRLYQVRGRRSDNVLTGTSGAIILSIGPLPHFIFSWRLR